MSFPIFIGKIPFLMACHTKSSFFFSAEKKCSLTITFILIAALTIICSCKKTKVELSPDKYITDFSFFGSNNAGVTATGVINGDSIKIAVGPAVALTNLVPTIGFKGKSISPASNVPQDFTGPVNYTVTALDGSSRTYVVILRHLSDLKGITSFVFKATDNPGVLTSDITATMFNDTIRALLPPGTDLSKLVPQITYNGISVSPASKSANNFVAPALYTISAESGSTTSYKVFAGSVASVYFGSNDHNLYALDGITGRLRWKFQTGAIITTSPTIYKGLVISGSNDGFVYALDTAKGTLVWKQQLNDVVNTTPSVANDMVYVTAKSIFAFEAATGKKIWEHPLYFPGNQNVAVSGHVLYAKEHGPATYAIEAFNALTGDLIWSTTVPGLGISNPAIYGNTVYSSGQGGFLMALDVATGASRWNFNPPGYTGSGEFLSPTVSNGVAYITYYQIVTPSVTITTWAVDATTGTAKWSFPGAGNHYPVVNNGLLWLLSADGTSVVTVDAVTGVQKTNFVLMKDPYAYPTTDPYVVNEVLFVADSEHNIYAFDALNGTLKWQFKAIDRVTAPPVAIDSKGNVVHPGNSGEQQ